MATYTLKNQNIRRGKASETKFILIQINCNGISRKLSEIKLLVYTKKPDIVCLCETWLNDQSRQPVFIGYNTVWKNRGGDARARGGLMFLIRKDIKHREKPLNLYENGKLELIGITVATSWGEVDIINLYNPGKDIQTDEFIHYITQINTKFILCGDLNAHSPTWDSRGRYNATGRAIEEAEEIFNLNILNNYTPTYIDRRHGTTSCLDLCITSSSLSGINTETSRGPDIASDHFPMITTFGLQIEKLDLRVRCRWQLNKANWREWTNIMNEADTCDEYGPGDAEMNNRVLIEKINKASKETIPRTSGKVNSHRYTPWWDIECSRAVAERRRAKGKLFGNPSTSNLIEYKRKEAIAKRTILKKKKKSFEEFVGSLNNETSRKSVWQKINSISGKQKRIGNYPVGDFNMPETAKANLFAEHFTRFNNNIRECDEIIIREQNDAYFDTQTEDIETPHLLYAEVESAIKNSKNTTPGKDEIGNELLKRLPSKRIQDIVSLFNISLISSNVPAEWKEGICIPILKRGKIQYK